GLSQRLDGRGQAALVASGLVLVNDVLVGHAINHARGFLEHFVSRRLVTGVDRLAYALDGGAQHRAQAGVVLVALDRLTSALAGLGGIGHVVIFSVNSAKSSILASLPGIARGSCISRLRLPPRRWS